MASEGKEVLATPINLKRPASDEADDEAAVEEASAAKKAKPASSFSELASRAKDNNATSEATPFASDLESKRASMPLSIKKSSKSTESGDSDHSDSPGPLQMNTAKFTNSPMEVPKSPLAVGSFSLAPPTLAAPGKKDASESSVSSASPATASSSATGFAAFHKATPGSHLIKDFGFGPRPVLDKAPKPSVPSENPFLQCLQKKTPAVSSATADGAESEKALAPSHFVFGQGLTERIKPPSSTASMSMATNGSSTASSSARSNSAGGSSAAPAAGSAAAAAAAAHDLPIVDVVTGEEDEKNVIQISGRLYNFNRDTRQWVEKGRAIIRLNDKDSSSGPLSSRLVIRSAGSLRVMVNCSLWPAQSCEKVNMRSARLTVMTAGQLEIVLVKASPVEIADLVSHINTRLNALKNEKRISRAAPPSFTTGPAASSSRADSSATTPVSAQDDAIESAAADAGSESSSDDAAPAGDAAVKASNGGNNECSDTAAAAASE